jgi:hypothetical protein
MAITSPEHRSPRILGGFLVGLTAKHGRLIAKLLHEAVEEDTLAEYFPFLQAAVYADADAIRRLRRAVALKKSPIHRFRALSGGRWAEPLPSSELGSLLFSMADVEGGFDVAVQILSMRLLADKDRKRPHDLEIIQIGRQLIERLPIKDNLRSNDHYLGNVLETCLSGPDGIGITRTICERFKAAVKQGTLYGFYRGDLIRALLKVHPSTVLDVFLAGDDSARDLGMQMMRNFDSARNGTAISGVPAEEILAWCNVQPTLRFPRIAALIDPFHEESTGTVRWSAIAQRLLAEAPEPVRVLEQFVMRIEPFTYSGSRAAVISKRLELLRQLEMDSDPSVAEYASQEYSRLRHAVEKERTAEKTRRNKFDQTFE